MSILKNAVESIQLGMEDYHSDDPRRVLSAIRNLYAGLLLMFKHKLQQLSPADSNDSLLKAQLALQLDPKTKAPVWKGCGKKTVDKDQIEKRLKALNVTGVDWDKLKALQQIRNNVEHSFSDQPINLMKEAVANSLHLLTQFCNPHLGRRPVDLFGEECWDMMLAVSSFHDAEVASCQKRLESVQWPFKIVASSISKMRCNYCDSQLLQFTDQEAVPSGAFECLACQAQSSYRSVVGKAVAESLLGENYNRRKAGHPSASDECQECGEHAYIYAEQACVACHFEPGQYAECEVCGTPLSGEESFSSLCSYHRHQMSPDD